MTEQEMADELVRMAERYKMDEDRRRVRMVAQPQNAGNAQAIPETPQSGPDLNEYAYLGSPSPPVQGTPGMPSMELPAPLQSLAEKYRNAPPTVASTGGTTPFLQPAAREFFVGNDRSIMEPDLLTAQRGGYAEHELPPHMTSKDGAVVFRDTGEPVPVTQRPGVLPLTVNAATGKPEFALPRFADLTGASMPSTKGSLIARGLGMRPIEMAPGEVALGSGPTWYHPIAKNKLGRPLEEMSATREPTTELAPRKIIEPEKVQGRILTTLPGDRTTAGSKLTAVNEHRLAHDVELQGGPEYMLANKALWASQPGAATTFQDRINQLAQQYGQKPLATFTAMGQRGGDYAHMNADTVLGMLPSSKVLKKDQAAFDAAMRDRGFADFVGIADPKKRDALREQMLARGSGNLRKAFLDEMAAKPWQEKGFPDVGSARFATTNPDILHDPHLSSGYLIGETAPGRPTVNDPAQHLTYTTQIPGKAIGGFERAIPIDVMYPDWYKTRPKGEASPHTQRAIITQGPHQVANQKWVDRMSEYLRRERERDR